MQTTIAFAVALAVFAMQTPAMAQGSIVYFGPSGEKYDRTIEAAAIKRAAEKIGDLRGSIQGSDTSIIIDEEDLKKGQSSRLGFPVPSFEDPGYRTVRPGTVPIV